MTVDILGGPGACFFVQVVEHVSVKTAGNRSQRLLDLSIAWEVMPSKLLSDACLSYSRSISGGAQSVSGGFSGEGEKINLHK